MTLALAARVRARALGREEMTAAMRALRRAAAISSMRFWRVVPAPLTRMARLRGVLGILCYGNFRDWERLGRAPHAGPLTNARYDGSNWGIWRRSPPFGGGWWGAFPGGGE